MAFVGYLGKNKCSDNDLSNKYIYICTYVCVYIYIYIIYVRIIVRPGPVFDRGRGRGPGFPYYSSKAGATEVQNEILVVALAE